MNLTNPITITPPSFTKKDGTIRTFDPIVLESLDITIIDSNDRKSVIVKIDPCQRPLVLWENESYDAVGDYTQAQVEARINELLGNDPSKVLENLFVIPQRLQK